MTHSPRVLVSVLNYNLVEPAIETLRSLERQVYPNFCLELVDNSSTNDCHDQVRRAMPHIPTVEHTDNLGYAAGMNAILERGFTSGYDYVVLSNNDITVDADALACLVETAETRHDCGVVGGVEYSGFTGSPRHFGGLPGNLRRGAFPIRREPWPDRDPVHPVDFAQGCLIMWTKRLFEAGVRYDTDLYMYYEEVDIARRMEPFSLRSYVDQRVKVRHFNAPSRSNPRKAYYMQRNRVYIVKKYGSLRDFAAFFMQLLLVEIPKDIVKVIVRYQPDVVRGHLRGTFDGLRNRRGRCLNI